MTELSFDESKAYIRTQMSQQRNSCSAEQRKEWSEAACKHAIDWLENRGVSSIMTYVPFRSELDLSGLMEWGWRTGRAVIVPRCNAEDFSMSLYYLRSWDELAPGAYGIREPDPKAADPVERSFMPEVVFVPGLAFDRRGGRLGYGGGYYDRFAARLRMQGETAQQMLWIGAAFEKQLMPHVPLEKHDLKMNGIVTELAVYIDEE